MRKVNNSIAVGKRKEAVARAYIKPAKESGKGIIRINGVPATIIEPELARMKIQELVFVMEEPKLFDYNIEVFVQGGGIMGQVDAARTSIARVVVKFLKNKTLAAKLKQYDRSLLSGDSRRVEPKKYGGRKARKRFQKSFR
jgi:small subunit ribosomal protein S9